MGQLFDRTQGSNQDHSFPILSWYIFGSGSAVVLELALLRTPCTKRYSSFERQVLIHIVVKANASPRKFNDLATTKDHGILGEEHALGFTATHCPKRFWPKKDKVPHVITHPDRQESVLNKQLMPQCRQTASLSIRSPPLAGVPLDKMEPNRCCHPGAHPLVGRPEKQE